MTEEEQNITVLRKRRRNSNNGSPRGSANGHARKSQSDWGWTRPENENPFAGAHRESESERDEMNDQEEQPRRRLTYGGRGQAPAPEPPKDAIKLPFDPWRLLSAVKRRWWWLLVGAFILGGVAFFVGSKMARFKVSVPLIRRQVDSAMFSAAADPNRPAPLSDQTLFAFMRSGEILRRVAARAATSAPPINISAQDLGKAVAVMPTANPDILMLSVSGEKNTPDLATLANIYAEEVVSYTRDIQASESGDVAGYLAKQVAVAEKDLADAKQQLMAFEKDAGLTVALEKETEGYHRQITDYQTKWETARIEKDIWSRQIVGVEKSAVVQSPSNDKLKSALEELDALKLKYTEEYPDVILQRKKIEMLRKGDVGGTNSPVSMSGNTLASALYLQKLELESKVAAAESQMKQFDDLKAEARKKLSGLSEKAIQYADLKSKIQSLESTRQLLAEKQQKSKLFIDSAMGFYRVIGQAGPKDVNWKNRTIKVAGFTMIGAGMGLVIAILLAFFLEVSDTRLKTVADIERTTKLPVFATLGDLKKMSETEQINWAFRTLTILRGKLCATADDALVCGIISSNHGEGRSTWVNLLVSAASQRGLRVLTVDTRPTAEGPAAEPRPPQYPAGPPTAPKNPGPQKSAQQNADETAAAHDLLAKPMAVAERLKDPESIVHIPIPGWVWSLDRRQQWQEALSAWREIDNTVILIELPPASCPEAILLAEKIPQLIWLTGSGMADVKETREQLETLRHAHCNVVGAALNFEPPPPMNNRLSRWFNRNAAMILLGLGLCGAVQAQEKLAFSATTAQPKRALWQQKLTLGPGDAMDISLFGQPTLMRTNIFVGPDGRISYLQAQGVLATGLTIEELRARLDQELTKFYNGPRTIIIPTVYASKKYYVLGKVVSKGVYSLDRPMTVLEAVARAQGLETGLYDRNTVEMADLSRSFLIRNGSREKVDLEKLFLEGDLAQNIPIEPDDFLFFGAAGAREIYVLGQVQNPGPIGFVSDATLLTAITDRGGFTDRAYRGKVLVVRGSLNKPETFVIDAKKILTAADPDFKLESRDIIYVGQRPWIRAEELLDEATQSFIQGFVTAFTGVKIGPWIKNPIFGN